MNRYNLFSRLKSLIFLHLSHLPMSGHGTRPKFVKWGGVKILDTDSVFIGEDVLFDTVHPELITIESGVRITMRTIILTHYLNPVTGKYSSGSVLIKEGAFIGANVIITKPVIIGKNAVVGSGSIVTKNIPAGETWAGNPAKCIHKNLN